MNWSSVKNLLIAILVAANLFLIFNIVRQDRTRGYISDGELRDAIELLGERGFSVLEAAVPTKRFKAPVYESQYDDEYYTEVATTLSGSEREMLYTMPNGGISISTKNGIWLEFDNGFDFRYSKFDISNSAAYTEITADTFANAAAAGSVLTASRMKSISSAVSDFLCRLQPKDSPLSAKTVGAFTDSSGRTFVLAEQYLDGYKVYSHYAVCVFEDTKLIFAHGRWYFSDIGKSYSTELCDQVNILFTDMTFLKSNVANAMLENGGENADSSSSLTDSESENIVLPSVSSVTACYAAYWNSDKTALYFIPAWQIDHIDSLTIVYNAANATVYSSN